MWITTQVNLFFGSFRKADADDPEVFTAGCFRLFAAYAPEVVTHVTDPLTGLPGAVEWLPSLRAVKAALDERAGWLVRQRQRQQLEDRTIADRRAYEARRAAQERPTLHQLRDRYGQRWGLPQDDDDTRHQRRLAVIAKANAELFKREYDSSDAGVPVSASLRKALSTGPPKGRLTIRQRLSVPNAEHHPNTSI